MDWDKLRVFHAVAEAGSFTHAGDNLNLSQSAVSRQISALEESLKAALFHRHARGLILTEQGELLFETVHEVFGKLASVEARLGESRERPEGPLTITTTLAFGTIWLTPRIRRFMELYPDIDVTLALNDTELDLAMRQADVAVRFMPPRQPDLIQRQLVSMPYHVFAAPEYLQAHGYPERLEDLDHHSLIMYADEFKPPVGNINWLLSAGRDDGRPRKAVLRLNNLYGIFRAVESGLGIAALPEYFSSESSNLVRVLPDRQGPVISLYFVYAEEMRHSKRVAVFRDFLITELNSSGFAC
ncbi:LysR family transcriptional regulator [Pararhodospirillum oryzae]|uniref:LysR family transcriptional regulator n=1 Tax=Pararhodospirillum oryzae TaxID=478448 RepID=A0A512HAF9_9PROT|nr:LysR family transcriptional regulator [Pararhodospirillum oryzae]GEO82436.1 LysR family transcriptional regulator [Pararhodospirillum oryzae]